MIWKIGQTVVCDRPEGLLIGDIVQVEFNSLVISCAASNAVICGQQQHLQKLGWRLADNHVSVCG